MYGHVFVVVFFGGISGVLVSDHALCPPETVGLGELGGTTVILHAGRAYSMCTYIYISGSRDHALRKHLHLDGLLCTAPSGAMYSSQWFWRSRATCYPTT